MSIKAIFLSGQTEITVNGLHQWDYGQQLEIHADDLPAMFEVHFACVGMDTAVVRSCSSVNGVGTVTIPDLCLEQSAPIFAWIYEIDSTKGTTIKTITLKVTPRAKPQPGEEIPVDIADKYTEALTEMNEAIGALKDGLVIVAEATHAQQADEAGHASEADHASEANRATTAVEAETLIPPAIVTVNAPFCEVQESGLYCFLLADDTLVYSMIFYVDVTAQGRSQHCRIGTTLDAYLINAGRTITVTSSSGAMKIRDYIKVF